jgi:hypothetical protein
MSATIHPLFAKENDLRAAERAIINNPLYKNWESKEHPMLLSRLIEIQNEIKALHDSDEYVDAITPSCASVLACYGGI